MTDQRREPDGPQITPTQPSMPESRPDAKATVKFEPPPKWAEAMFGRVHEGINAVETRINAQLLDHGTKLDSCVNGLGTVTNEVERIKKDFYEHKGAIEARAELTSMRVKQASVHDDEQDKQIAKLSESQMAELLKAAAKTPLGQKVVNGVVLLVVAATGYGTFWLSTHAREQPPTIIQVAPAAAADGGLR